jgi:hypothetical protein
MITLNTNNFGGAPTTFKDYQSTGICVLNGHFSVDPTTPEYLAAERLELDLPADFAMIHSAMSSAILMSSYPIYLYGTLLRCWIENNKLCIEKLTVWDSFGLITIYINSAFVTRGYRGTFTNTESTNVRILNTDGLYAFYQCKCVVNDNFVYFVATFNKFPSSYNGSGPFTMQLSGFPTDVEVEIPLIVQSSTYDSTIMGSKLCTGQFSGGNLTFNYPTGATNMGGSGSFFNFFAAR